MNGIDFLNVCNEYCLCSEIEKLRTSISRSYYALHHHILQKWESIGWGKGYIKEVGSSRKRFLRYVRTAPTYVRIHRFMHQLTNFRDEADYQLQDKKDECIIRENIAKSANELCKTAIAEFNSCDHNRANKELRKNLPPNDIRPKK